MVERDCAVMREMLRYQDVAIKPVHLGYGKHPDAAKAHGRYREHLSLGYICLEFCVLCGLKTEKRDFARGDLSVKSASRNVRFRSVPASVSLFSGSSSSLPQVADGGVTAM